MSHRLDGRWVFTLAGVLLLALPIWFWGPLLEVGGRAPLASAAARQALIALPVALGVAWLAGRRWLARRRNDRLAAGLAPEAGMPPSAADDGAASEVAVLGDRMRAAMAVLRKANPGWRMRGLYLYQLPWYIFVGAPGSGKTTALSRSGLEFPLADTLGPDAIGGIGGTRNCDWWFTNEAVLLDTAGRYTTQDSQGGRDRAAWSGFLALLKKYRPRCPINGVIVAISVADLLQQSRAGLDAQARAVRARIQELQENLGLALPVYVLVTKSDLLAGFAEFFEPFGREERSQVLGMTFGLAVDAPSHPLDAFGARLRALEIQLQGRVLERMHAERDLARRALIYGFPQQFAALEEVLEGYLRTVFQASRYEQRTMLRGIYFTSGTQQGSPIDRVMASLAASFGLGRQALPASLDSGRSYFVTRLLRDVIFPEAGLARHHPREARRRRLAGLAGLAAGASLAMALGVAITVSYVRNGRLVEASGFAGAALARQAAAAPRDGDELALLPLLDAARDLPAGHGARGGDVSWLDRMGLYQGEKLGDGAAAAYRRLLRSTLLPRLVARMEAALRSGGREASYEALRVYMMLGHPLHLDADAVLEWAAVAWTEALPQASTAQRRALAGHLAALVEGGGAGYEGIQLDGALVAQARTALAGFSAPERVYMRANRKMATLRLADFSVNSAAGRDASGVLARSSGESLSRGVSGVYSAAGYQRFVQLSWLLAADVARENWVLEPQGAAVTPAAIDAIRSAVLQLYFIDYIRAWDVFLADIRVAPLTSLDQASRVANALAGPDSPLRAVLQAAARETSLAALRPAQPAGVAARASGPQAPPAVGEQAAVGAALVDQHFAALHRLAGGATPMPLEQALALVKDAGVYLDAVEQAQQSGAPAPAPDALLRLKRGGEGQAAPLPALFQGIHDGAGALAIGGERARLNALWNAGPAQFCRSAIGGRYPLARGSTRDATADDFARFFAPGGLLDAFFTRHLAASVDMTGPRWRWRPSAGRAGISEAALAQFQRGMRLRDMFFSGGALQPTLRFALRPLAADPGLGTLALDLDGQEVVLRAGQLGRLVAVQLPTGKGNGEVRLAATAALPAELRSEGPWAWLRMVDRGTLEPLQPERYRLRFDLAGRQATYELTAASVINPFGRQASSFECPASL